MVTEEFITLCKEKVAEFNNATKSETSDARLNPDDVYVVWYCKTLQNHKALLSTPISDGMYYELTYNGDTHELYFDAYKKWQHLRFAVEE